MFSKRLITTLNELIDHINKINSFEFNKNPIEEIGCSYDRLEFNELGCQLFDQLFEIGQVIGEYQLKPSLADQTQFSSEINQLVIESFKLIVNPISYNICLFLDTYPVDSIDSAAGAGETFSYNWCIVRSGYQYLLDLYQSVKIPSDNSGDAGEETIGLDKLKSYQRIFDCHLKNWHTNAFDIESSEIPKYIPETHWWWFKNSN